MTDGGDYLVVAVITGAFGIKGWLKLHSFTDPPANVLAYRHCFVRQGNSWRPVEIEDIRPHGNGFVIKLRGCDDRNAAESWRRTELAVSVAELPELDDGEFYWHQLEGLAVRLVDEKASLLGVLDHLVATGSNDVLVVEPCEGSIDQRQRLLPYRPEVVRDVDLANGVIRVDWDSDF